MGKQRAGQNWETSVNGDGQWDVCEEGGGDMVADLAGCGTLKQQERRARLIAAAPDMSRALRDAYEHVALLGSGQDTPLSNSELCDILGSALEKAGLQ